MAIVIETRQGKNAKLHTIKPREESTKVFYELELISGAHKLFSSSEQDKALAEFHSVENPAPADETQAIRLRISEALGGKHLPTKARISKWIQAGPEQLEKHIDEHITYWQTH